MASVLGTHHRLYLRECRVAHERLTKVDDLPPWLALFGAHLRQAHETRLFKRMTKVLKPWESHDIDDDKEKEGEELDLRFSEHKNHLLNRLAMFMRGCFTKRRWFRYLMLVAIVAVSAASGYGLEHGPTDAEEKINKLALALFTLEFGIKILAEGEEPYRYFTDPSEGAYNFIDFFVLVLSFYSTADKYANGESVSITSDPRLSGQAVFRLAWLVRLLSVTQASTGLRLTTLGFFEGVKTSGYIALLLGLLIYVFAVFAVRLFGDNDPASFGEVGVAAASLFQVAALSNWSPMAYTAMYGCDVYNDLGYNTTQTEDTRHHKVMTRWGKLPLFDCTHPAASRPGVVEAFYFLFLILAVTCGVALFVGTVAVTTFSSFDAQEAADNFATLHEANDGMTELLAEGGTLSNDVQALLSDRPVKERVKTRCCACCGSWAACCACASHTLKAPARLCATLEGSSWFQFACGAGVVAGAGAAGYESDNGAGPRSGLVLGLGTALLAAEIIVRIGAQANVKGRGPLGALLAYLSSPWNLVDVGVLVAVAAEALVLESWPLKAALAVRLVHSLRLFRSMKSLPKLRAVVDALFTGLGVARWIVLLFVILVYTLACSGMVLFRLNDPFHFGSLRKAVISVLRAVTGDSWDVIMKINMYGCDQYPAGYPVVLEGLECDHPKAMGFVSVLFFGVTVVVGGFVLPSVLVGVIASSFHTSWDQYGKESVQGSMLKVLLKVVDRDLPRWWDANREHLAERIFAQLDADGGGTLDFDESEQFFSFVIDKVFNGLECFDSPEAAKKGVLDLLMLMDSSGGAAFNLVEFVSFFVVTKQVMLKLGIEGFRPVKVDGEEGGGKVVLSEEGQFELKGAWTKILTGLSDDLSLATRGIEIIFLSFNRDGEGEIEISDFDKGLQKFGVKLTITQLKAFIASMDEDGNGKISRDEFVNAGSAQVAVVMAERAAADAAWGKILLGMDKDILAWHKSIEMIFKSFDKHGTGEIDLQDFASSLKVIDVDLPPDQMLAFVTSMDDDGNGKISFKEFMDAAESAMDKYEVEKEKKKKKEEEAARPAAAAQSTAYNPAMVQPQGTPGADPRASLLAPAAGPHSGGFAVRNLWAPRAVDIPAVPVREKPKPTDNAMAGPKLGSGFKVTFVDRKVADAFFKANLGAYKGPAELPRVLKAPKGMAYPQPGDILESVDGKKLAGAPDTRARALELVALVNADTSFMARFIKGSPDDLLDDGDASGNHARFMASPSSKALKDWGEAGVELTGDITGKVGNSSTASPVELTGDVTGKGDAPGDSSTASPAGHAVSDQPLGSTI